MKYVTAGSNFSIDPAVPWNQVLGGLKDGLGANKKKGAPKERENKQISEFKRQESKGITSIANIATKAPNDRDDTEK